MLDPKASQNGNPCIGIDIGGTSTRIGSFQSLDTSDFVLITKFPTEQDYQQQLQQIKATLGGWNSNQYAGIGVSIAGRIAKDGRSVIVAPNLPEYVGKLFAQ